MSSSWGNTINFTDEPNDMYGRVMSISDELVDDYFVLCTRVPLNEIESMKKERESSMLHPRDMKMRLARDIVTIYHGEDKAVSAEKNFVETFSKKGTPKDVEEVVVNKGTSLVDVLLSEKIILSKNEFRTLIKEGAISNTTTGDRVKDPQVIVENDVDFKIGKRRFIKIRIKN